MAKFLMLLAIGALLFSAACFNQDDNPTEVPTPTGPALSVEEYTKACNSAYQDTLNDRGRSATQEQMRRFIADLRELVPPRSLEKFHYAYMTAMETTVDDGVIVAIKEWMEADAQIGQLDDETYNDFQNRGTCGFDAWFRAVS